MAESFGFFSILPLHLLPFILSFLPFKDAVRTSVLSKKWLNICKSMTNIEFNELFFIRLDQPDETREAQRKTFLEFIKFWIENHKGTVVEKFSLRLSKPGNVGEIIDQCVDFATQRGVKQLALDFADANRDEDMAYFYAYEAMFKLPTQVYKHSRLESLKLYSCSFVETEILNFHALKEVSLGWMEVSLNAIKVLLSNCNMLESLSFKKCWSPEKFDLGEEEHVGLRKLILDNCGFDYDFFRVNAPNLKIFNYCGMMNFFITKIHSLALEEVDLDFSPEYGFEGFGHPLCNLVEALSTTRVLTVCNFILQVIPSGVPKQLPDMDVRHLIMKTSLHEDEFMGITFFLNICPMLERLTIELSEIKDLFDYEAPFYFNTTRFWIDDVGVYKSMCSSLKVLEVNGFRGTMNEQTVLSYFIFSGLVLEKLSINMFKDAFGMVESHCPKYAENLLKVPRASSNLEISIS